MSSRQKKKISRWIISICLIAVIGVGAWLLYQWLLYRKSQFTRYAEFGIGIPTNYTIHGIDVSRYQQLIAWEEVKSMKVENIQLGFAFIKATEGIGNVDPQFNRNWRRSKNNEIVRGAYHFFIASKDGKL
jgi:lysozyme